MQITESYGVVLHVVIIQTFNTAFTWKKNLASIASKQTPIKMYKYNLSFNPFFWGEFSNMHYENCF